MNTNRYSPENLNRPQFARLEDLPMPFPTDLVPRGVEAHDWWCCRYCDAGECNLGLTTDAEATRALAHQAFCRHRPASDKPDAHELEAFQTLFGKDCRREIDVCAAQTTDLRRKLDRTWWPFTRRKLQRTIKKVECRQRRAADRLCEVSGGPDQRILELDASGTIVLVNVMATEQHPVYKVVPHEVTGDGATQRYMIVCDEGWRKSIVCERMYHWSAMWLINQLGREPYAPETRP